MALNFTDVALAVAEGGMKGAVEVQEERNKALQKRLEELRDNRLELAKSKHITATKEWTKRTEKFAPVLSAGSMEERNYYFNKARGDSDEIALAKASDPKSALDLNDEYLKEYIGDEPLLQDYEEDYSGVQAQSVLGSFGIGEEGPTVDEQIAAIQAKRKAPEATRSIQAAAKYEGEYNVPDWMKTKDKEKKPQVELFYDENTGREYKAQWDATNEEWVRVGGTKAVSDKDMRGTLKKKYDDAYEIAVAQNIENPEDFAFKTAMADKDTKDLRGTTRKKFDDLVYIKVNEMKIEPTVARAEALAEVLREEKDNRSAFKKKFDEKVEMYKSIKKIDNTEAERLALADIEQENIINRDIVVPTIMAISRGEKVPAEQMAAFKAYNTSRGNFFSQAMQLGGEGLDQFIAQPGENPMTPPPPSATVKVQPKAMPVEQALAILREKPTPEMVQFFTDTYGEDKLPPEFKQQ
jgi:hypothetical protein